MILACQGQGLATFIPLDYWLFTLIALLVLFVLLFIEMIMMTCRVNYHQQTLHTINPQTIGRLFYLYLLVNGEQRLVYECLLNCRFQFILVPFL